MTINIAYKDIITHAVEIQLGRELYMIEYRDADEIPVKAFAASVIHKPGGEVFFNHRYMAEKWFRENAQYWMSSYDYTKYVIKRWEFEHAGEKIPSAGDVKVEDIPVTRDDTDSRYYKNRNCGENL